MVYKWRNGARYKVKAQVVGERIDKIRSRLGGQITPKDVVADARGKSSPLHKCFEWNNAKAADSYRLFQARNLIASVEVVYEDAQSVGQVRAFVCVREDDGTSLDYHSTSEALTVPALRKMILERALREANEWRRRHKQLQELSKVFDAIDDVSDTLG